jgi:hypothetical protein
MVAIVTLSVVFLTVIVGAIVWKLGDICMYSHSFLSTVTTDVAQAEENEIGGNKQQGRTRDRVRPC